MKIKTWKEFFGIFIPLIIAGCIAAVIFENTTGILSLFLLFPVVIATFYGWLFLGGFPDEKDKTDKE